MKILLIEDDPEVRQTVEDVLSLSGFDVVSAGDGAEGLQLVAGERPDLVLCDIVMPVMDGYDVLERLRADPQTASLPFIFLSAKADRQDIRRGMNLGAEDYLAKPFTRQELLQSIHVRLKNRDLLEARISSRIEEVREQVRHSLSHELLTPLTGILGFAELIEEEADRLTPGELREMARMIRVSGERQHQLIRKVLCHAELEMAMRDPSKIADLRARRTQDPAETVRRVSRKAAEQADRIGDLEAAVFPDIPLAVDAWYLEALVQELVENAFKFSSPGEPVRVSGRVEGGALVFRVEDRGIGMTAEQTAQIGAFVQFGRSTREQQGMGLGLAICRRIAELYGGVLTIESLPGKGTTVTITLPLA